jgi:hypothetical protein
MRALVSISLVVVGLAIAAWIVTGSMGLIRTVPLDDWIICVLLLASGAMIGGGLLAPFGRTWLTWCGALIGVVLMGVVICLLFLKNFAPPI